MSEDGFQSVKTRILKIFQDLDEGELSEIKDWICNQSYQKGLFLIYTYAYNIFFCKI